MLFWKIPLSIQHRHPPLSFVCRLTVSVHSKNEDIGTATVELPLGEIDVDAWVPVMKNGKTTGNVHLGIEATGCGLSTIRDRDIGCPELLGDLHRRRMWCVVREYNSFPCRV